MAQVSVALTTTAIVTSDPDNWRTVVISNTDATNPIFVEVGAPAVVATSLKVPQNSVMPAFRLPPGQAVNGIATGAPVDTRYMAI